VHLVRYSFGPLGLVRLRFADGATASVKAVLRRPSRDVLRDASVPFLCLLRNSSHHVAYNLYICTRTYLPPSSPSSHFEFNLSVSVHCRGTKKRHISAFGRSRSICSRKLYDCFISDPTAFRALDKKMVGVNMLYNET
jgi:hypothetical protein